jgi:uncharacterized damage-inducible protein DinB
LDKATLQTLWAHNTWANEQILRAAAALPAEALRQPVDSGHGSLFGTLLHLVDTEYGWRMICEAGTATPVLTEEEIPDLAALAARARAEAAAMSAYLATLSDTELGQPPAAPLNGKPQTLLRWQIVFHVISHGAHHRGESAAALTACGQSPGELDFMFFLRS